MLFVKGDLQEQDEKAVAVVGTRTATKEGVRVAHDLALQLARRNITVLSGLARGIDTAGATLAIANGSNGVSFVDVTTPSSPRVIGTHALPGSPFAVALSRGAMYVASELGLNSVANVATPPMLNESLLTITPVATTTTVTGAARSLTGITPVAVQLKNTATNATSTSVNTYADGSFDSTVAATPGQPLTAIATDAAGRTNTRSIGRTWGATKKYLANPATVSNDQNYRARRVASDGNYTLVTTGSLWGAGAAGTRSGNMLLFRQPNASEPAQIVSSGVGGVYDVDINSGYAYVGGDRFGTINLADLSVHLTADPYGGDASIAVSNGYAFTGESDYNNDARINIYNVSNPAAPVYVRQQNFPGLYPFVFRALVPMGSSYLIALSPDRPGGAGHDIQVIDRTNVNNLMKIGELEIANFDALDGVIDGSTLYVAGGDGGVAIVDMTNPFSPQLKSVINTPGIARGIAVSGVNEIVVADAGGPGITFIDVTDKAHPTIIGSQKLIGNVVDVNVVGKSVYVAAENFFHMILRP